MRAPLPAVALRPLALAALTAIVSTGAVARAAEPNESGAAAAESLFQEGRHAMDQKKYGDACPKFLASYKLSPAIGTLLNLADCYEKNGQLASAWARFHEAIALGQRLGRADREKTAKDRAEKLEPRLIRLTILAQDPHLDVKLDGNPLDSAVLGTPVPIDPGKHTIDAAAKGKKAFHTTIDVSERTKSPSVEIPELEATKEPTPPKETPKEGPKETPPESTAGATQRTIGIVAMGLGAAGLGVGVFFGLRTSATWSDAQKHCTGIECDPSGVSLAGQAKDAGNIATIAFIAGGVVAAGGAALFFTAPSPHDGHDKSGVSVGVGPGDVLVRGRF
jgi:hypothetical protein